MSPTACSVFLESEECERRFCDILSYFLLILFYNICFTLPLSYLVHSSFPELPTNIYSLAISKATSNNWSKQIIIYHSTLPLPFYSSLYSLHNMRKTAAVLVDYNSLLQPHQPNSTEDALPT